MAHLHTEENWRDKCERYIHRQTTTTQQPAETPRSGRSIIPPVRSSGKYKVSQHNMRPDDVYIRKAFTLSSIHGLPFVTFLSSRLGRITWSVIIAINLGCLVYLLIQYVQMYLENSRHFESVSHGNDEEASFPTLTLCNLNTLQKRKLAGSSYEQLLRVHEDTGFSSSSAESNRASIIRSLDGLKNLMRERGITDPDSYIQNNKPWLDIYSDSSLQENDWLTVKGLLSKYDGFDLWKHFLQTSREEAEIFGQSTQELVVKCKDGREECEER